MADLAVSKKPERVPAGCAACVDVETTGLNPGRDEVIELAMVLFTFDRVNGNILEVVEEYTGLREPSCPIGRKARAVHGISLQEVQGCNLDEKRVNRILDEAELLVAHNAAFDFNFVSRLFPAAVDKPWYCSMKGISWSRKGVRSKSLERLLQAHDIKLNMSLHRAGSDVQGVVKLLSICDESGKAYFQEMLTYGPIK